ASGGEVNGGYPCLSDRAGILWCHSSARLHLDLLTAHVDHPAQHRAALECRYRTSRGEDPGHPGSYEHRRRTENVHGDIDRPVERHLETVGSLDAPRNKVKV